MGYFQKFQLWELFKIRKRNEEFHMSKITWDTKTSVVHGCVLISCLAKAQSEIRLAGHTFERRTQLQCVRCIYRDGSFGVYTLVILQVLVPVICLYCLIRAKVESVSCPNLCDCDFSEPKDPRLCSALYGNTGKWEEVFQGSYPSTIAQIFPGNLCAYVLC